MTASETVPVKVEDLHKWAILARGNAHIGQAEQIERYLPKPEQPVKVLLSELKAILNSPPGTAKRWALESLIARLEASDD